eukprot:477706_1
MPFTVFFFFFDDFFFDPLRDLCLDEGDLCLCFFFGVLITKSIAIPTNYTTNYTTLYHEIYHAIPQNIPRYTTNNTTLYHELFSELVSTGWCRTSTSLVK